MPPVSRKGAELDADASPLTLGRDFVDGTCQLPHLVVGTSAVPPHPATRFRDVGRKESRSCQTAEITGDSHAAGSDCLSHAQWLGRLS